MITTETLPPRSIDILLARMADEQSAFYFYISASAWCRLNGFDNASAYFQVEAHGEEYHYKRIADFLTDWNYPVKYAAMDTPIQSFVSLQDILEKQYALELNLYKKYEIDVKNVFQDSQASYQFLCYFISIQSDSVVSSSKLVNKMKEYIAEGNGAVLFDKDQFFMYNQSYSY